MLSGPPVVAPKRRMTMPHASSTRGPHRCLPFYLVLSSVSNPEDADNHSRPCCGRPATDTSSQPRLAGRCWSRYFPPYTDILARGTRTRQPSCETWRRPPGSYSCLAGIRGARNRIPGPTTRGTHLGRPQAAWPKSSRFLCVDMLARAILVPRFLNRDIRAWSSKYLAARRCRCGVPVPVPSELSHL